MLAMELDDVMATAGGAFSGQLTRQPDIDRTGKSSRARAVRLTLRYRTEGRGDTDSHAVDVAKFELQANGALDVRFSLAVPASGPISYDGSLIRVLWEIEARVDVKLAIDPKTERPVLVVPAGGFAVYDRPHPLSVGVRRR